MGTSTRIFVDFWNFQLNWQDRSQEGCDWKKLPTILLNQAGDVLKEVGQTDSLDLDETLVHASVKSSETKLRSFLENFLDKQPSFRVKIRDRRTRKKGVWCNACKKEFPSCHACGADFVRAPEKGVDTAIVTDLLTLASERMFR